MRYQLVLSVLVVALGAACRGDRAVPDIMCPLDRPA